MADVGFRNFRFTPSYNSSHGSSYGSSYGSSGRLPFRPDRFRLTLEDEKEARHLARSEFAIQSSRPRRSRGENTKNLLIVRHLVWQEREDREAREREQKAREEAERERIAAEKEEAERRLNSIDLLPEEIMLTIFSLLELEDLARSVVPVCSRWRRLGRDESLWSHAMLRYDPLSETTDSFIRTLMVAPVLGAVEYISDGKTTREDIARALAKINLVSDKLLQLGSNLKGLTTLDLGGLRFNDFYGLDGLILDVVRAHTEALTVLRLPPSMTSAKVLDAVAECTQLKVLAIWITPHITSALLSSTLQNLELESLTWRNYDAWLDKAELAHFILHSDRFRALDEFRLVDCIDMDDGLALAIANRCEGLSSLSLHRSELTGRGLSEILQRARGLHILDLYKNSTFTAEHLDTIPAHLPDLQLLDIRGCWAVRTAEQHVWERILEEMPELKIRFD